MVSKLIVAKSNDLVQASYSLSIAEQRIILLCLAKLDSRHECSDSKAFVITVDDLIKETGVGRQNAYRDLSIAVSDLFDREIKIDDSGSKLRWVYEVRFSKGKSEVELFFSPTILPYITALKERYLTYRLRDVAKFTCKHSIRIYELIMQRKDRVTLQVEVFRLRELLGVQAEQYPRVVDLKRFVIDPALEDINLYSPVNVCFDQVKSGRTITHFIFNYSISVDNVTNKTTKIKGSTVYVPASLDKDENDAVMKKLEALAKIKKKGAQ